MKKLVIQDGVIVNIIKCEDPDFKLPGCEICDHVEDADIGMKWVDGAPDFEEWRKRFAEAAMAEEQSDIEQAERMKKAFEKGDFLQVIRLSRGHGHPDDPDEAVPEEELAKQAKKATEGEK